MTRRQWLAMVPAAQFTADEQIRKSAAEAKLSMRFTGSREQECRQWQQRFRARLSELLGAHDPPGDWETVEEERIDAEDHTRLALVLRAAGHPDLPVYVLLPKRGAGPRAGVLALHGHGPDGHDAVVGLRESAIHYDYGLQLVRRGYVVAAPCFTPFGRRLGDPKAYRGADPCAVTFVRQQLLGKVLMAENLRDSLWSLELLARRPEVNPDRLACVGLSYGGRMTMLTGALSPKVKAAVCAGALNLMQERIEGRYSCGAQVIPGLLRYGDVPEIASLIAPRPCLWEVGNNDPLMVKDRIEPALERMRRAWNALKHPENLKTDFFEGGHEWDGEPAYRFLEEALG